ncbi:MAG TPA: hypothetical protein VGR73_03820 [Bryobacteraceae bacterium]|nr:hypothetical protein [Bryobacteraceae bacterium]
MARLHPVLAVLVAANLSSVQAASPATGMPVIGVVEAHGAFRLDHATVSGNATLFEGAIIETAAGTSSEELRSGARVTLAPESRGRFFGDHVVLERGQGRLDRATGYFFEARGLTIQPETGASTGRITLDAATGVQVAALTGSLRVLNAQRMVVAKVLPGAALAFSPQAGGGATRLTGHLVSKGGHYLLTDETTNVTVEITGAGLKKLEGQRVEVSGYSDPAATPVSDATQVIRATTISKLPGGTAAAGAGGTAAGGGVSGLAISATTVAIIGGVAAAAVVGGLAATGTLSGGSTVSR